jgi:HlyD family secretion protein
MSSPTIFTIVADLGQMQLNAGIDESDIARIRPFQSVRFQVDAHPGESFAGTVTQVRLEPTLAQNVVTYNAVIAAPNPDLKLRPGMTASVNIQIASRDDVVRIPNAALRFRPTAAMYAAIGQTPSASTNASRREASGQRVGLPPLMGDDEEGVLAPPPSSIRDQVSEATTVDALFAPLGSVESDGTVWVYADNRLTQIPVRLGITDGQVTELLGGNVPPGMELVTNLITGTVRATTPASTGGFFMSAPGGAAGRQGGTGARSPRG